MRYISLIGIMLLSACADQPLVDPIAARVAESKAIFERVIPNDWTPDNFPLRVISDYKSKGAVGVVAMDETNTITTFEICTKRTKKCYDNAAIEAVANCENTVNLGLQYNILTNVVPKCKIVIINNKFVHRGKIVINNVEYTRGSKI